MSRHKLVKGLDLEEELGDYDGDDADDEELAPEVKENLKQGLVIVRKTLGSYVEFTDKEIEDSLYYYYYDVQKTINYLLNQRAKSVPVQSKNNTSSVKVKGSTDPHLPMAKFTTNANVPCCSSPISAEDFFKDSPWLNVPMDRRGSILVEPLHPHGGLLGGSSKPDGPPKSKLAALAAARRKKENQKIGNNNEAKSSTGLLQDLSLTPRISSTGFRSSRSTAEDARSATPTPKQPKNFPASNADVQLPNSDISPSRQAARISKNLGDTDSDVNLAPAGEPSTFAQSIFGHPKKRNCDFEPLQPLFSVTAQAGLTANKNPFAVPSPDDVVLKAQNSSEGSNIGKRLDKTVNKNVKEANKDFEENVKDLVVSDAPKAKSNNIDVVHEYNVSKQKKAANLVVIGHVDAGKSTLMGRLLHDLDVVDRRTIDRYRREAEKIGKGSFALAWVLDQGTEERERGVTIDVAMNKFETEETCFTILDAPGHRDFIPNMIAGASQADFAILVIDASTGNFESGLKGQTKEHALLVRSMGVQRVVIAVNKFDTVQWSQQRFDEISQQISAFLIAAGFLAGNISIVPCSGLTGDNVVRKATEHLAAWYTGPPLISLLESSEPITRAIEKPLRLTIDDIFRGGVQNPLSISGRIDSGTMQVGDVVLVIPAAQKASIKGLEVNTEAAAWAVAGQNVNLHLADIEAKFLRSGDVICTTLFPMQCVTKFTVRVLALEHIMPMRCEVHKGRLHVPGKISQLVAILDKSSGAVVKGKRPKLIRPGLVAKVVVEVEEALPLESGSRIILRAGGETLGAGLLL